MLAPPRHPPDPTAHVGAHPRPLDVLDAILFINIPVMMLVHQPAIQTHTHIGKMSMLSFLELLLFEAALNVVFFLKEYATLHYLRLVSGLNLAG